MTLPTSSVYCPDEQSAQSGCPTEDVKRPEGHGSQEVAPVDDENVPAAQASHDEYPDDGADVPASQIVHAVVIPAVCPYLPGSHGVHWDSLTFPDAVLYLPVPQGKHDACSKKELYFPASQ